ncbi:hypothetical protein H110_02851 [Trichophyton rubrum MR1448]|nr:hypothetical protein H110_02851 [Trichophyton rubrum MR1448]
MADAAGGRFGASLAATIEAEQCLLAAEQCEELLRSLQCGRRSRRCRCCRGGGVAATFRRQQLQLQLQHHQQQHPQQHPQTEMMAVGGRTSIDISRSRAVLPAVVLVFWPRWWRYRQPCNLQPDATDPRPDDKKRRGCRT